MSNKLNNTSTINPSKNPTDKIFISKRLKIKICWP